MTSPRLAVIPPAAAASPFDSWRAVFVGAWIRATDFLRGAISDRITNLRRGHSRPEQKLVEAYADVLDAARPEVRETVVRPALREHLAKVEAFLNGYNAPVNPTTLAARQWADAERE